MIATIVLAAGQSKRMGCSKLTLPWGKTTVLGQVIATLAAAGINDILVVTGGAYDQVNSLLVSLGKILPIRSIYCNDYAKSGMLSSLQIGLSALKPDTCATLVALGDQPQILEKTVRQIITAYHETGESLIIPSFHMRLGHPWLVARRHWPALLALNPTQTPRDFIAAHATDILYLPVETDTILQDIDTPEEYEQKRPRV